MVTGEGSRACSPERTEAGDTISPMRAGAEPRTTPAAGDGERVVPELSVVMPCLNEARTIGTCIRKAQASFERIGIAGEVVVADNGSTDGSQEIAEELGARVVPVEERGYGAALTGGIAAARGRWVIMGDADDSYDFSDLEPFVRGLREGYDLVNGNRFKGGIQAGRHAVAAPAARQSRAFVRRTEPLRDAVRRHLLRPPRLRPRKDRGARHPLDPGWSSRSRWSSRRR